MRHWCGDQSAAHRIIRGDFLPSAGFRGALAEACRNVANGLQLRLSWRVRAGRAKASVVIAANSANRSVFARVHRVAMPILTDVGVSRVAHVPPTSPHEGPIRLLWSGLLDIARRCTC